MQIGFRDTLISYATITTTTEKKISAWFFFFFLHSYLFSMNSYLTVCKKTMRLKLNSLVPFRKDEDLHKVVFCKPTIIFIIKFQLDFKTMFLSILNIQEACVREIDWIWMSACLSVCACVCVSRERERGRERDLKLVEAEQFCCY